MTGSKPRVRLHSRKRNSMKVVQAAEAQTTLPGLRAETATSHEPIRIVCDREHAVLIAEEDWRALQETLYLLSVPGMRESIRDGLETSISECSEKLEWRPLALA